jgi:hypothetical protein
MDSELNRRIHKRLAMKISVLCQTVGVCGGTSFTGKTVDVSPGGMLVEFNSRCLSDGQLLSIEMSVPPTEGLLEYGGRFSSYARITRVDEIKSGTSPDSASLIQTAALEFCQSPRLRI